MNRYYVEFKKSQKTGSVYPRLMVDTGVRQIVLTFDRSVISEILDVSPRFLSEQPDDTIIEC